MYAFGPRIEVAMVGRGSRTVSLSVDARIVDLEFVAIGEGVIHVDKQVLPLALLAVLAEVA